MFLFFLELFQRKIFVVKLTLKKNGRLLKAQGRGWQDRLCGQEFEFNHVGK